ncbi:unnamed protein product [Sympodiomycopsis kandeliae]
MANDSVLSLVQPEDDHPALVYSSDIQSEPTTAQPHPTTSSDNTRRKGSLRLLFSPLKRRHAPLLILATTLAIVSGGLPPLMTKILGNAFDAYTQYDGTQGGKDRLMDSMVQVVWHLCLLALGTMILSTSMITVWVVVGEMVAFEWRKNLYVSISQKKMDWFDLGMGSKVTEEQDTSAAEEGGHEEDGGSGAFGSGGLMAKFARETDDVRLASSQQMGQLVQYATTAIAALVLALVVNWSLTLVILASIPLTAIVTTIVEVLTGPQLAQERRVTSKASGIVERSITGITTIKAFNAQLQQLTSFDHLLQKGTAVYNKTAILWGVRLGISTTLMFAMFVQGFWFGSYLVSKKKVSPGDIMTVFWSCILVSGHIQQIIESLNLVEKGKISALGLSELMQDDLQHHEQHRSAGAAVVRQEDIPSSATTQTTFVGSDAAVNEQSKQSYTTPQPVRHRSRPPIKPLQRIIPSTPCRGEITLRNVSFTYPSAKLSASPSSQTLQNVDMFFPAGETTFIVGGSGSGKSTIAQLLLRLYRPDSGVIEMDEQNLHLLDPGWCRHHIASIDQEPIIFDMSVHDNVAIGLTGGSPKGTSIDPETNVPIVPRSKVVECCKMSLLHDFLQTLPQDYSTILNTNTKETSTLSGGQKQKLSIARMKLRDPTVLILDEFSSALDLISKTLIYEAIKVFRKNKTTIIITHDLSQVASNDFLYFLDQGRIVEHGYRSYLDEKKDGYFATLAAQQRLEAEEGARDDHTGSHKHGFDTEEMADNPFKVEVDIVEEVNNPYETRRYAVDSFDSLYIHASLPRVAKHSSTRSSSSIPRGTAPFRYQSNSSQSRPHAHARSGSVTSMDSYTSNISSTTKSMQFDPKHTDMTGSKGLRTLHITQQWHAKTAVEDSPWLENVARAAEIRRQQSFARLSVHPTLGSSRLVRRQWSQEELNRSLPSSLIQAAPAKTRRKFSSKRDAELSSVAVVPSSAVVPDTRLERAKLFPIVVFALKTMPKKTLLVFGLTVSVMSGAITPLFSFFLAKLLATLSSANQHSLILRYALTILGLAFAEGISCFARFSSMEMVGGYWVAHLRKVCFEKVLSQDRSWFDKETSSAQSLVTRIIKDAEDARNLIARSVGALLTVCAMVAVALIWSMSVGWQLTLIGLALAPIYIGVLGLQSRVVAHYESRNKIRREEVAKRFYSTICNIRGIRSMALEPIFATKFYNEILRTRKDTIRSAPFRGFGFGLGESMTYLSEALMFYVGAVLIIKGIYTFEKMVIVFNLIIFAVTFAGEILAYLPGLTLSLQATKDLKVLYDLTDQKSVLTGIDIQSYQYNSNTRQILSGAIEFRDVHFSYPSRRDVRVLKGVNFTIYPGETVAIVGSSGCGKSTIASLLERMYDVSSGSMTWGHHSISSLPATVIRNNLSLVSQKPDLFDMTIADNVTFGSSEHAINRQDIITACKLAHAHDFIDKLPKGYDTYLGENASLISGGQRQRIAIARGLYRILSSVQARVLILDEATSALDNTTRAAVTDTLLVRDRHLNTDTRNPLLAIKDLITILVTHKLDEMKKCDKIIVLDKGTVVQCGTFTQLSQIKGGVFSQLANAGEWGA